MCKDNTTWTLTQLSHVCTVFRQVSIEYSALWSDIQVEIKPGALKLAELWLERAVNIPVTFRIRYRHVGDEAILAPWLTRNASMKLVNKMTLFHLVRSQTKNGLLGFLATLPIQTMESFCILGLEDIEVHMGIIAKLLRQNQNLSSLSLSGAAYLHDPHSLAGIGDRLICLSFGELSYVDYTSPLQIDAILGLLVHCPNLVTLECYAAADESEDDDEDDEDDMEVDDRIRTVCLSSLVSLTIGDGPETCRILVYLYAPALRRVRLTRGLALDGSETEVDVSQTRNMEETLYATVFAQCMQAFQQKNGSIITGFILDRTVASFSILQACASYLTSIERLEFWEINDVPLAFLRLGQNNCLYVSLQYILMHQCSVNQERWQAIMDLYDDTHSPIHDLPKIETSYFSGASNISVHRKAQYS